MNPVDQQQLSFLVTVIFADNQGAIVLMKNDQFHGCIKHVDIQHHYVWEAVANGNVEFIYKSSREMIADGFTKPLAADAFSRFREQLGLRMMA